MRISLINMPWAVPELPAIALGILKNCVVERLPGIEVGVEYANLSYSTWITEQPGFGDFDGEDYQFFVDSYFLGLGDWVFAASLHGVPEWRVEEYAEFAGAETPAGRLEMAAELQRRTVEFVDDLAARIVADGPQVVGLTSTFQQNAASLALARAVKRLDPGIVTVIGGANCDGPMGAALHRNFGVLDYVIRGEGELAFPALLEAVRDGTPVTGIPGLCGRDAEGISRPNTMRSAPLPTSALVAPEYTDYFAQWQLSAARNWSPPALVVEGARGCWWGEKHHCTFCGLNGTSMQFRSKSPGRFFDELVTLAERYRVLDFLVVDNILDMAYIDSLVPRMAETGYDWRFNYEVKANLRLNQLRTLAGAGLVALQSGIESLSGHVLGLMDKGVTGCLNIRMLRDAATAGIVVIWNYLYGFPGETDEDYDSIISQLPALHHLIPPAAESRIVIERFSPYADRPELGFPGIRPGARYRLVYDLPPEELADLAYVFDSEPCGIGDRTAARLRAALAEWTRAATAGRLTHVDLGDSIVLVNRRPAYDWDLLTLTDPVELAAFRLLHQPRRPATLAAKLELPQARVDGLLARWTGLGLLFHDGGQVIQVAPEAVNEEMLRAGAALHETAA